MELGVHFGPTVYERSDADPGSCEKSHLKPNRKISETSKWILNAEELIIKSKMIVTNGCVNSFLISKSMG